jgi:hypothetical protein
MSFPTGTASVHATDSFDFVYGRFQLSGGWTIPYLNTVMTFRQAKESLDLVTEFAGWESISWRLEELFQRDIDWPRVERKIVPYLSNPSQPRFFNSLTVALQPVRGGHLIPEEGLAEEEWSTPLIPDEEAPGKKLFHGPVAMRYYQDWDDVGQPAAKLGKIRWNKDETFCVAIDGQHRLAAIKQIAATGGEATARADVPVILLVLSKKLGFTAPPGVEQIDVLRRLFIDLNKHANPVSRTRLILLDDRDPTSLCTRATIGGVLADGFAELSETPAKLPLSLVDWHTDGAKVEKGPYVVSVLTLDWAIQRILNTGPMKDPMQYSAIRQQINRFSLLEVDLSSAKDRLEECQKQERPFAYLDSDPDELGSISEGFEQVWSPSLTHLFSRFAPYDRLIDARRSSGSHIANFSNWFQLYHRSSRDSYGGHATKEFQDLVARWTDSGKPFVGQLDDWLAEAESKKRLTDKDAGSLAFAVVFQKALVMAWQDFLILGDLVVEEAMERLELRVEGDPADSQQAAGLRHLRHTVLFVELLNRALEAVPEFLYLLGEPSGVPIWLGSLLSADKSTIDFTEAAAIRAQDIILMAVYVQVLASDQDGSFSDLISTITDASDDYGGADYRLNRARRSFAVGVRSNTGHSSSHRILSALQQDAEDEEAKNELADERLELLHIALT